MTPRIKVGKGVSGCLRYVFGEGRDPKTGELLPHPLDGSTRVAWFSGAGFGFAIDSRDDAELARRVMEFDALNQGSKTKKCEQDCVHLSLSWARGQTPGREDMETAAHQALGALGMSNAKALFVAHNDEDYAHLHIVASKLNPDTGYAYDLERSHRKLSKWALGYEREHGGVQLKGREDMNELRDAIARRDAGGVLEALTKQRSTFTAAQLERELQKEIYVKPGAAAGDKRSVELARAQFAQRILDHVEAIHLSDAHDGPTTRYTTRKVLEAEGYVWRAAETLAANKTHGLSDEQRFATLNSAQHDGISREQARAFRHATGEEGLAIIDGLAGAGKSRTTKAVREAYEAAGYRVIGTAWTHKVVQSMDRAGFDDTGTVKRQLFMLANGREKWDSKTVVIVDEASMLDTAHMAMLTVYAQQAGAKLILVGDDRQLSSIERGGMFGVLKDRYGAATLTEINRQVAGDDRRASEYFAEGQFHKALGIYDAKGAIHWTRTHLQARAELLDTYQRDVAAAPDKSRFIFAYTNQDCRELNAGARAIHRQLGHLGQDHELDSADGTLAFAPGDRIQFLKTDKQLGLTNASVGTIRHIENGRVFADIDSQLIGFDSAQYRSFRHGYAGTIFKGQGATVDQSYLYHSEHWRSAASYVGMTRHRDKAELFVATNSAENLDQLARQMARVDEGKRYAASHFHHRQEIGPVRPLSAREVMEHFASVSSPSPEQNPRETAQSTTQASPQSPPASRYRRRARVIIQPAAEMRGARTARRLRQRRHPHSIKLDRQKEETGKMDDYEEEEQRRRRRAGVGIELTEEDFKAGTAKIREAEEVRRAWQQPAFTAETIAADPWTAVYLPMPEPDMVLLDVYVKAHHAAVTCTEMIAQGRHGPRVPQGNDGPEENFAKAQARLTEIVDVVKVEIERRSELHENAAANQNDPEPLSTVHTVAPELGSPERDAAVVASLKAIIAIGGGDQEPKPAQEQNPLQQPFAEREGRGFQPSEPPPGRYDALRTEVSAEAIAHDEWNAVALDLPADADPRLLFLVAETARGIRLSLSDRAGETFSVPDIDTAERQQAEIWSGLADKAGARQKEAETLIRGLSADTPMSKEAIDYDPWAAVYQPIPADADPALLEKAYAMAVQCAGTVARPPSETSRQAFAPTILYGKDQTREENFERVVRRIDDLDGRLQAAQEKHAAPEPAFSHETIRDDPWTAVYSPIPPDGDAALLQKAHDAAKLCAGAVLAGPAVEPNAFEPKSLGIDSPPEHHFVRAAARIDELSGRLRAVEQAASETEFSHETMKDDPWTAVYLDIPANADYALLKEAHATLVQCCQAVSRPPRPFDIYAPDNGQTREQNFENAVRRLDELGSRLRASLEPGEPPMDGPTQTPGAQEQKLAGYPGLSDKVNLVEEILFDQGDLHSHYDIAPWQGGFALFRTYEIEDPAFEQQYPLPTGQQILGCAETLDQLHESIIDGSALIAYAHWVTDEQMNEQQNSYSVSLDDPDQSVPKPAQAAGETTLRGPQDKPFSIDSIEDDPWNAVYQPIPADADATVLHHAYEAAMHCCAAATGPGGVAEVTELNFERATERLDQLYLRLNAIEEPEPLTLDEISARLQRILDDPTLEAAETDPSVLQALQDYRAVAEAAAQDAAAQAAIEEIIDDGRRSGAAEDLDRNDVIEYDPWTGQALRPDAEHDSDSGEEIAANDPESAIAGPGFGMGRGGPS